MRQATTTFPSLPSTNRYRTWSDTMKTPSSPTANEFSITSPSRRRVWSSPVEILMVPTIPWVVAYQ